MYADRHAPARVDRASLGLSVGIVGALLAAGLVASPVVEHFAPDHPLTVYPVHVDPPPPPERLPEPAKKAAERPAPPERIDHPVAQVPSEPTAPYVGPPATPPMTGTGTPEATGTGAGTITETATPLPPVLTGAEVDARYARDFQPVYPSAEQRAGRDGVVTVKVLIGVDGRVREAIRVLATSDEFWRVTERQALTRWRFRPATRDAIPVEAWRTMTVRFRLQE